MSGRLCKQHEAELRAAVIATGLGHLMPPDELAPSLFEHASRFGLSRANYDPFVDANITIAQNALLIVGPGPFSGADSICPICYINEHGPAPGFAADWPRYAAAHARREWEQLATAGTRPRDIM